MHLRPGGSASGYARHSSQLSGTTTLCHKLRHPVCPWHVGEQLHKPKFRPCMGAHGMKRDTAGVWCCGCGRERSLTTSSAGRVSFGSTQPSGRCCIFPVPAAAPATAPPPAQPGCTITQAEGISPCTARAHRCGCCIEAGDSGAFSGGSSAIGGCGSFCSTAGGLAQQRLGC